MFKEIKKRVLMEYLIKEIDCLEPLENVYKTYVNSLLEIYNSLIMRKLIKKYSEYMFLPLRNNTQSREVSIRISSIKQIE